MMHMSPMDYACILLYGVMHVVGVQRTKNQAKRSVLAEGRLLTLPAFVASMVSTWYGAILGVGEFIYERGIFGAVAMSVPYYLFALAYAVFFIHKAKAPLHKSSDRQNRTLVLLRLFILFLFALPGAYFWMGTLLFASLGFFSKMAAMVLTGGLAYILLRQGRGHVYRSNALDFVFMYAGFLVLVVMCLRVYGGVQGLPPLLPVAHLKLDGPTHLAELSLWLFIGAQTFIDPALHQRIQDAKCA
ncbi:MAG: hypothetical protein ACK5VW_00470, partial [Holosporales bacterium]